MSERLIESLLKHMNIKSVYYYNSNLIEAGRVDDKFLPQWSKFIAGQNVRQLVANNTMLGDTQPGFLKYLFINFTLFNDTEDDMFTLTYKEEEVIDVKTLLMHLIEQRDKFVNIDKLAQRLLRCVSYPFPHVTIDDFIESDKLTKILADVNQLQEADAHVTSSEREHNKYVFNSNYGTSLKRLFVELNSPDFIKHIERITGVDNIICNDHYLYGTGVYRIKSKGFLQLHTDFNTYHSKNSRLDRRVNLLIYLNPNWKADYNGQLCLCDKYTNICVKRIDPIMNRCVIFNTTSTSIHGIPEPLNVPDDVSCQYISVNYYTENTQGDNDVDFEGCAPRGTTWYPDINISAKSKQIFYV